MRDSLLLWDIDGTLVCTDRAGERSLLILIKELYGRDLGEHLRGLVQHHRARSSCALCK